MNVQHEDLARGRWSRMPLCEQMANIGSEVSRALNWRSKGRDDYCEKAVSRALELIDLSLATAAPFARLKELARVREAVTDYFYGSNEFSSTETSWRKYFDHYGYAVRR